MYKSRGTSSFLSALEEKRNVMSAVMLRDMRTRFFNHGLGFLIVSFWPLGHIFILITVFTYMGRTAPYGDDLSVFFATGLLPSLTFMYVSRFMAMSLISNKPMLNLPIVHVIDVMMARACLEILAAFLTLFFAITILTLIGANPLPYDQYEALYAYLCLLLLAIGAGTLAGVITMVYPFFLTIYTLCMILVYLLSGTLFVPSALPEAVSYPLSFNPVLHAVEWVRTAYYQGYSDKILDKQYLLLCGVTTLFLGLLLERTLRRYIFDAA